MEVICSDGGKIYLPTPRCDQLVRGGPWGKGVAVEQPRHISDEALRIAKQIIGASSFADPFTLALWIDLAWSLEKENSLILAGNKRDE